MPPAEQVREVLERILESEVFARSGRARDLLRYIVEQDLAGNADRLKGFSIAIDVFGKSENFDPSNDPVVRVQAVRLRELLSQYYQGVGAGDPIHITIPRGSYAPAYAVPDEANDAAIPKTVEAGDNDDEAVSLAPSHSATDRIKAARSAPRLTRSTVVVIAAALSIVIAVVAYRTAFPPSEPAVDVSLSEMGSPVGFTDTTGSVYREDLPSIFIDADASETSERVATLLRRGIAGFDTVNVIARSPTPDVEGAHLRTDFVFTVEDHGEGSVLLEVRNIVSGKVLLSKVADVWGIGMVELEDNLSDVLSTVVPVSGVIYASIVEEGTQTSLIQCLVLNDRFYREQSQNAHEAAYRCLEDLASTGSTSPLIYSELGSLHIQAIHNSYDYPEGASPGQALEYARQAVQYGPGSPYAHRSMGYVLSRTASADESLRWTQKAYELNTFDLGMAASYGYAMVFAGDYRNGTPVLQRAVNAASAHPTWWDYGLFLGHFMNGDHAAAANAVSALGSSDRAHYVAARLIAAHELGDKTMAATLVNEIISEHRTFAGNPLAFYTKASYPAVMRERLASALHAAGLGGAS